MRKRLLLWGLAGLFAFQAAAQQVRLTGTVTDATDNQPLPGAGVAVKGTTRGTLTDAEGNYALDAAVGEVLVFSFIGQKTTERTVATGETTLNVALEADALRLDEVVAIGYGTARKRDLTGATASLNTEDLVNQPVVSATQAIQGKLAGVQVMTSGEPGSTPMIRIRGTGTLLAGADPLYVVDGVLTEDIRNINPQDITSIDILKDASSTAIYGVRAANGVVLVTTKRGRSGQIQVNYDGYVGFRQAARRVDMADAQLYVDYNNEALVRAGQAPSFTSADIRANTNWFDEITRNALVTNHNLSVSGGGEKNTFFLSGGYLHEDGLLRGNGYRRFTIRGTQDYQLSSWLKLGTSLNLAREEFDNKPFSAFTNAYKQAPIVPVRNADGSYGFTNRNNVANPVAQLDYTNDRLTGLRLQGVVFGEANLTQNLLLRSSFSIESRNTQGQIYNPVFRVSANQLNQVSNLALRRDEATRWVWDNTLTYARVFGKHDLRALVGLTAERFRSAFLGGTRQNIPDDPDYWYLNTGAQATATNESGGNLERRLSFYGRVNYNFDERYLLTATLRRDGSSKFPTANRWSLFPSVGAAWRIAGEDFMQDQTVFSELKLRASWGRVGNDRITPNAFLYTVNPGLDYPFGTALQTGYTIQDIKDPNLRWEITTETNLGLEFGLFQNKLGGEIDLYDKQTNGALIFRPIDAIFGDADNAYLTNAADIRNRGVEVVLRWNERRGDFRYNFGVNFTANQNRIVRVNGGLPINGGGLGNGQFTTRTEEGQPIGAFWVYRTDGLFRSQAELDAYPHLGQAKVGDLRYVDTNGDGIIDDDDRQFVGSYQPKFYYGFTGGANYKNFDLSLTTFGNAGNQVYNGKKAQRFGNENVEAALAGFWTTSNPDSNIPRPSNDVPVASDYYVESGSYFRINNVSVGYTFPKDLIDGLKLESLRVYATAQNPITFQRFSGFTPELPRGIGPTGPSEFLNPTLDSGIELDAYPTVRTFNVGLTVGF
jgi:TonB-linked SusC/RagA family outer membrane protein